MILLSVHEAYDSSSWLKPEPYFDRAEFFVILSSPGSVFTYAVGSAVLRVHELMEEVQRYRAGVVPVRACVFLTLKDLEPSVLSIIEGRSFKNITLRQSLS